MITISDLIKYLPFLKSNISTNNLTNALKSDYDGAVSASHSHSNKDTVLDLLSTNTDGDLLYNGSAIGGGGGFNTTFYGSDVVNNTIVIVHNLGNKYPDFKLYGNDDNVIPDSSLTSVTAVDEDTLSLSGLTGTNELLLHLDGLNNSNTITNSSYNSKSVIAHGGAVISNAQSKFGSGALYLPGGAGDYLTTNGIKAQQFNSDFTLDMFLYPTLDGSASAIFSFDHDWRIGMFYGYTYGGHGVSNNIVLFVSSTGSSWNMITGDVGGDIRGNGSISLNKNQWNHVALVREGNNWRTYINGVKDLDLTVSGNVYESDADIFRVSQWGASAGYFTGYMDEFYLRFTPEAVYTGSEIVIPVAPFNPANPQFKIAVR